MDILFNYKNKEKNIAFNKICLMFGENNSGKSKIINTIKEYINNGSKNIKINGNYIDKGQYNLLYFDEETDFAKEFKFTKSNVYRSLIYDDIINNIDQDKLLYDVNELLNTIDNKVNNYVKKEIDSALSFDTNITDINKIIEKFTDIYFNDYILTNDNISKSIKRKLIYQLLSLFIKSNDDKETFIIIDNFDIYLDNKSTIEILNLLQNYAQKYQNIYIIITTNKNIYKYVSNKIDVFKIKNDNIISFDIKYIEKILNDYILLINHEDEGSNLLINNDDIKNIYKKLYIPNKYNIGEILVNNDINLVNDYSENINQPYIYISSENDKLLLELIIEYIDNNYQ